MGADGRDNTTLLYGAESRPPCLNSKGKVQGKALSYFRGNKRSDLASPHLAHLASYQLMGRPHWGHLQRSSSCSIHF